MPPYDDRYCFKFPHSLGQNITLVSLFFSSKISLTKILWHFHQTLVTPHFQTDNLLYIAGPFLTWKNNQNKFHSGQRKEYTIKIVSPMASLL